jgi:alpha-beta hydrolase superfamily lysophospholipase
MTRLLRYAGLLALALLGLAACAPTVVSMGPPVTKPRLEADPQIDDRIVTADGAELPLTVWKPNEPARAVILAVHGFNDYSNAFEDAAKDWAEAGIVTYAYDQRGFGRAPDRGLWVGTETLVSDLEAATRLVHAQCPKLPLYVLGESMGGAEVIVAAAEHRLPGASGTILVAPAVRGRETLNVFARAGLWFFAHTVPWLAGQPGGQPLFLPSDNIPMLRKYSRDPLVIKDTRIDTFYGLVGLMDDALAAAPYDDMPSLILIGAKDDLIPGGPSKLLLTRLPPVPPGDRRVAVYPKGYHMLLRDLDAELAIHDVAFWVLNPHAPQKLPSGDEKVPGEVTREATAPAPGRG